MAVKSIKHTVEKRAHIPTQREAGFEEASSKVKACKGKTEFSPNPIGHRDADP